MSAKPATLPRWANVTGDVVTPSSGKQDLGWIPDEAPPAEYLNWLQVWNYKWAQYLSDGAMSGAFTFDNAVDVTGLITAHAGVVASANQDIVVSGTGKFKHPIKTIVKPLLLNTPAEYQAGSATHVAGTVGIALANNTIVFFPLPEIPTGSRYVNVYVYFNSAGDRTACTCVLYATSSADPATTTLTSTSIPLLNTGTAVSKATNCNLQSAGGSQSFFVQISNSITTPKIQAIVVDYDTP